MSHYLECEDLDCSGCLPTDDEVRAMGIGKAKEEAQRRGLLRPRARDAHDVIVDDADSYRARSAEARAGLEG